MNEDEEWSGNQGNVVLRNGAASCESSSRIVISGVPSDQIGIQTHALRAALGWLELGLPHEALAELDRLPHETQGSLDVLNFRWVILANRKDWPAAVGVSSQLIEKAPDCAASWLNHAYALRRAPAGGLLAAFHVLEPAASKFPDEPTIPYNLACYTCQLQRSEEETMSWLKRALAIGNSSELIAMALSDPDLTPVRELVEKLPVAKKPRVK